MSDRAPAHLGAAELERIVSAADQAAILVRPRILRRVVKQHRKMPGLGLQVPHRKSYVIGREALLKIAGRSELGLARDRDLPQTVILIARPDPEKLSSWPRGPALVKYWRLLFHSRIHLALAQQFAERKLTESHVRERIARIGFCEFVEVRTVLQEERFLLPPEDDRTVYKEFVALYLELRCFAGSLLPHYFPAIRDYGRIDKILADDIDAVRLFADTRLQGAPDPVLPVGVIANQVEVESQSECNFCSEPCSELYNALITQAEKVAARGNVVRAAILREKAAGFGLPGLAEAAHAGARVALDRLCDRLQAALALNDAETEEWRNALPALLPNAMRGIWPVEARLLYDLQKVCVDCERDTYRLNLVGWLLSFGRRAIKCRLPNQHAVLRVKHLRHATTRLETARLSEPARRQLSSLLSTAILRSELQLRDCLRPLFMAGLYEVGMQAHNLPEQVARDKLVEELLDRITDHGYLTMSHFRDAVSRNNLKLPDLQGPKAFFAGDRLLRANRRFAVALEGVYRRGEIYLRWLQRLSSAAFGTRSGRFVTRFVILPFGGAFVGLEGLQHMINIVSKTIADTRFHFTTPLSVGLLGILLLALLHVGAFRRQVVQLLKVVAWAARGLFVRLPAFMLRLPLVRRVLQSRPWSLLCNHVLKPLVITAMVAVFFPLYGASQRTTLASCAGVFLTLSVLLATRLGRAIEELVTDALVHTWLRFRIDLIPRLFRFVMDLFRRLVEDVERLLYTVDEWLRFRSGESRLSLATKAMLGVVWSAVTYLVRIYVNLLIEPTVNPIKHFPVVTVGAKLILPFTLPLTLQLASVFMPLGPVVANAIALLHVVLIPGVFGFLVWELKENWRLYEANRPEALQPVGIGHHGETMARLLRPGFHSGTLPKLYARLRRTERRALDTGNWTATRKHRAALHDLENCVRHFVDREFITLLKGSKLWEAAAPTSGKIDMGSNRIAIEFCCPSCGDGSWWVMFEERSGWLVAGIARPGWLHQLSQQQLGKVAAALAGLYKMAGVDLIREEIEASLPPGWLAYDVAEQGLVVWSNWEDKAGTTYNLRDDRAVISRQLLFRNLAVTWHDWVETWERDQAGKGPTRPVFDGVHLLPHMVKVSGPTARVT